jgi:anti-sigma factor (TIGR02949 family)
VICADVERNLDAYLDRELEPDAARALRDHLDACAACRTRATEREALGRLIRATPYHTAPPRLRAAVAGRAPRPWYSRRMSMLAAAAVLVLSVGAAVSAALVSRARLQEQSANFAAEEVVSGHVRSLMGAHLFDVESTDQHTVKPWFLGKLDYSPPVVDLAPRGFPLVGGRLDYIAGRSVAALVYERRRHTINVFVWPARPGDESSAGSRSLRGFHTRHWQQNGMTYWAVSDLNDAELTAFVRALQGRP